MPEVMFSTAQGKYTLTVLGVVLDGRTHRGVMYIFPTGGEFGSAGSFSVCLT